MRKRSVLLCLGLVLWGAGLAAALSLTQWSGDWSHGVCGPWGCGPPTQALVSCHLAWLIFLTPPAVLLAPRNFRRRRRLALFLILAAAMALFSIVGHQWATWWPDAAQWQRAYFWQRCGFCIATAVDLPILQTMAIGVLLWLRIRLVARS
jgi:hypothetical protein